MKNLYRTMVLSGIAIFGMAPKVALAHCPLCTIGAVAVGLGAYKLGVSTASVGIGVGAFAIALGLWIGRLIKKQYIPYQNEIIVILSFLTTVMPIAPLLPGARGVYVPFIGEYGTTLVVPHVLIGAVVGAGLVFAAPVVSRFITRLRQGKMIPFQGISITIGLLIAAIAVIEITL